jgi:hypothetical protein
MLAILKQYSGSAAIHPFEIGCVLVVPLARQHKYSASWMLPRVLS